MMGVMFMIIDILIVKNRKNVLVMFMVISEEKWF